MDSIIDLIQLRIPPINYVCPPLCPFEFSGSGSGSAALIVAHPSPCKISGLRIEGTVLFWDALTPDSCSSRVPALCYNVYHAEVGSDEYSVIAECIQGTSYDFGALTGCFRVTGITTEGECDLSDAACTTPTPPPTVNPGDFGPDAWWKADSFSLESGTEVGGPGNEWLDQSGNNNDLTQISSVSRPVFRSDFVNGKPVVQFDGVDDILNLTSPLIYNGEYTFMIVIAHTDAGNPWTGTLLGNRGASLFITSGIRKWRIEGSSAECETTDSLSIPAASFKLATARRDEWRENKTPRGGSAPISEVRFDLIGSRAQGVGGFLNGYIAEIVIYPTRLSDANVDQLYDEYFSPKYGI
jgi:hypothetical protein